MSKPDVQKAKRRKAKNRLEALLVNEISFVDKPAVPEAEFVIVKRDLEDGGDMSTTIQKSLDQVREIAKSLGDDAKGVFVDVLKEMSHNQVYEQLRMSLEQMFPRDPDDSSSWCWIVDVFESHFVYEKEGKLFALGYLRSDTEVAISADQPTEVRRVVSYEPVTASFRKGEASETTDKADDKDVVMRRYDDGTGEVAKASSSRVISKAQYNKIEEAHKLLGEVTKNIGIVAKNDDESDPGSTEDLSSDATQAAQAQEADTAPSSDAGEAADAQGEASAAPAASEQASTEAATETTPDGDGGETVEKSTIELAAEEFVRRREKREKDERDAVIAKQRDEENRALSAIKNLSEQVGETSKKLDGVQEKFDQARGKIKV